MLEKFKLFTVNGVRKYIVGSLSSRLWRKKSLTFGMCTHDDRWVRPEVKRATRVWLYKVSVMLEWISCSMPAMVAVESRLVFVFNAGILMNVYQKKINYYSRGIELWVGSGHLKAETHQPSVRPRFEAATANSCGPNHYTVGIASGEFYSSRAVCFRR